MSHKFTVLPLLFVVLFAACSKKNSQPSTDTTPYGISMFVNGKYSTFNTYPSVDTSQNGFTYFGTGDSSCCTNMQIAWGMNKADNKPLTTGIYPASGFDLENQSDWTIYDSGNWGFASQVGFLAYPDSVIITGITDSTITGTFSGTCTGIIMNPPNHYDSVMLVTNGKFHLKKW